MLAPVAWIRSIRLVNAALACVALVPCTSSCEAERSAAAAQRADEAPPRPHLDDAPLADASAVTDRQRDALEDGDTEEAELAFDRIDGFDAGRPTWSLVEHEVGELPRWIRHQPVPAETIEQIAFRYDASASSIRRANELAEDEQPRKRRPKAVKVFAKRNPPPREPLRYTAREGDSWVSLSRKFGVDNIDLRRQNWGATGARVDPGEQLEIWIDPTVYASIVDDAPASKRAALVRPGAHGRGAPQDGMLVAGVQIPPGEGYELRFANSAWGTTYAVRAALEAFDRYAARTDHPYPLRVGTMSRQRGGEVGGHNSHQTGRDLDIRLPLRAEVPQALPVLARRVDWDLVWQLIVAFDETDAVQVIFLDYRAQRRLYEAGKRHGADEDTLHDLMQWPTGWASSHGLVRHEPGHDDHIHVRFKCGPAESECVD